MVSLIQCNTVSWPDVIGGHMVRSCPGGMVLATIGFIQNLMDKAATAHLQDLTLKLILYENYIATLFTNTKSRTTR